MDSRETRIWEEATKLAASDVRAGKTNRSESDISSQLSNTSLGELLPDEESIAFKAYSSCVEGFGSPTHV